MAFSQSPNTLAYQVNHVIFPLTTRDGDICLLPFHSSYARVYSPSTLPLTVLCQTLCMFLARILFFRLHESPRYLVHAGRHQEALENLQLISRFNGSEISLEIEDVCDRRPPEPAPEANGFASSGERAPFLSPFAVPEASSHPPIMTLFDASAGGDTSPTGNGTPVQPAGEEAMIGYRATDESPNSLDNHSFATPVEEVPQYLPNAQHEEVSSTRADGRIGPVNTEAKWRRLLRSQQYPPERRSGSRPSSIIVEEMEKRLGGRLTRWTDRFRKVLSPEWFATTILVWGMWLFISLGERRKLWHDVLSSYLSLVQLIRYLTSTSLSYWNCHLREMEPRDR